MFSFKSDIKFSTGVFACVMLFLLACTNEPFTLLQMGISAVENNTTGVNSYFYYKNRQIRTFSTSQGGVTKSLWKFHYSDEGLERIVMDSAAGSYAELRITGSARKPVVDSIITVVGTTKTLQQTRRYSYGSDQKLSRIEVLSPGGTVNSIYDLKWTGDNITELKKTTIDGEKSTETRLEITHDLKTGVYSSDAAYFFTIPLDEIYWISKNNPIAFKRDTLKAVSYRYFYNSRGYPSHIRTDRGQVIGHTYTELR